MTKPPRVVIVDENSTRADSLYAWISDDGKGEGLCSAQGNMGWVPMIFATERLARKVEPDVMDTINTLRAHGQRMTVRLIKFNRAETLKEL